MVPDYLLPQEVKVNDDDTRASGELLRRIKWRARSVTRETIRFTTSDEGRKKIQCRRGCSL